jgi:hypothetical protein
LPAALVSAASASLFSASASHSSSISSRS